MRLLERELPDEQHQEQFAESSRIVARYEALRGAVLGDLLPPEARAGLSFTFSLP